MCENQCSAYMGRKRCINTTMGNSNHCHLHRPKATKLYLKYKKLCDEVEKFEINKVYSNKDQVDYLMNYYCTLNNAYKARLKHRQYAFVPECYDEGHLHQLNKLNNLMKECERMIENAIKDESEDSTNSEDTDHDENNEKEKISRKIFNYKQYRLQQEAETNQLIDKYIDENAILLKKRMKLISLITSYIDELFDLNGENNLDYFVKQIITYNLVSSLYSADYFHQFKPQQCDDITCRCYVPYDARLGCACIFNNNSIQKYFNMLSEDTIKKYYEILLLNKDKIVPLLGDVIELYQEHDDRLMFLKVHLVWHHDLKRLVLEPNCEKELPKMSKMLAQNRVKQRYSKIYF